MTRVLSVLALAAAIGGCVRAEYTRTTVNVPLDPDAVLALQPGASLQKCLDGLGAPVRVWETESRGFAMAYGWLRDRGWAASVSYTFARFVQVSFSYDDQLTKLEGAVLWFDRDWKLVKAKTGLLSDLLPPRRRPVDLDLLKELEQEAANDTPSGP